MDQETKSFLLEMKAEINKKFEQMDKRFERMEQRLDQHEEMIKQLINIVAATNKKVDDFMDTLAAQQADLELAHQKITKNERDIAKIKAILLG